MNEEEKQAIELLKIDCLITLQQINDGELFMIEDEEKRRVSATQVLLNLIEKQQKEIEYLKQQKEIENHTFNDKVVLETLKECVTKRSIRKLIEEKAKTDTYNFKTIAVKDIEELLGE